jgi:hypothetical protein
MHEPILVINAGSSSIKFSVFETGADRSLSPAAHGEVEGIGTASRLSVTDPQGRNLVERPVAGDDYESAIAAIHNCCAVHIGGEAKFAGIGHRVVHGGSAFSQPVLIDAQVVAALEALVPLAPLHQPHHIAAIGPSPRLHPTYRSGPWQARRSVRAQRLYPRRSLAHRLVRPMGRRARQGAGSAHHPRTRQQSRARAWPRQFDECADPPLPQAQKTFVNLF